MSRDAQRLAALRAGLQPGLPRKAIPPLVLPRFVPAARARVAASAPVLGVAINSEAHAYALRLLDGHEVVNDALGGVPALVTY